MRIVKPEDDGESVRLEAALASTRVDGVLTDLAAATAWCLPVPQPRGRTGEAPPVSVAVQAGRSRSEVTGIRGRRLELPDAHLTTLGDLRLTTPARTWLDCAALVSPEWVVAIGDAVLRRGLARPDDLARMVAWGRRRRGVVNARGALGFLDAGSESPGESLTRAHLVRGGIRPPRCNLDIFVRSGWIARADMAWEAERVIVEFDGQVHLQEAQRRKDAARRNLLQEAGWLVIVVTWGDLLHPWTMVDLVRGTLAARSGGR